MFNIIRENLQNSYISSAPSPPPPKKFLDDPKDGRKYNTRSMIPGINNSALPVTMHSATYRTGTPSPSRFNNQ